VSAMKRLRALSVRQPFAELIMRRKKRFEYRSRATNVRGRVYVYASLNPRPWMDWRTLKADWTVPIGVVIGTVEIVGCRPSRRWGFAWELRSPRRLKRPMVSKAHPQPVWFFPFGRPEG